jgi:hypothetical protein
MLKKRPEHTAIESRHLASTPGYRMPLETMRSIAQRFAAEHPAEIGPCYQSDLAHDERAVLANPGIPFAWIVTGQATYMARQGANTGRIYLRAADANVFTDTARLYYYFDGRALYRHADLAALLTAYAPEQR